MRINITNHGIGTLAVFLVAAVGLRAEQAAPALDQILARLDRLEGENQRLLEEVRALRRDLKAGAGPVVESAVAESAAVIAESAAPLPERVEVLERRSEEVDQTKVEASQRYPLSITGMALFNAFSNGSHSGGSQDPVVASLDRFAANSGATFRQTIVGVRFNGPKTFFGGTVTGAADFDLWGGDSTSLNHLVRLRTATLKIDWARTSISVAQDKPLISPRDPDSLAQVAFSPLTGAGNPWYWQPQVRLEQRFSLGESAGIRVQGALYQTREQNPNLPAAYQASAQARPGWEGRAEFWKKWGGSGRLEIASGFHRSESHIAGYSLPSDAFSMDWLVAPLKWWEVSGAFYRGRNLTTIGGGGPGVTVPAGEDPRAVHQTLGWVQSSFQLAPRLKLNLFSGENSNRGSDLVQASLKTNLAWGGNFMYHLAPNVITSFEALQLRTDYLNSGTRLHNHYDLALAYLF